MQSDKELLEALDWEYSIPCDDCQGPSHILLVGYCVECETRGGAIVAYCVTCCVEMHDFSNEASKECPLCQTKYIGDEYMHLLEVTDKDAIKAYLDSKD